VIVVWGIFRNLRSLFFMIDIEDSYKKLFDAWMDSQFDETRLYNCGGIPVELTPPAGEHDKIILRDSWCGCPIHYSAPIEEEIYYINQHGSKYPLNWGEHQ
jgi:hypothetical protein